MSEDNDYIVTRAERADGGEEDALPLSAEERVLARKEADDEVEELIRSVSDYADGLTSTKEETVCARKLRDEISPYAPTRLEAFRTPPYAGRNCCALLGVSYFFAAFFYFVSFGGSRTDGIILVLVALGVFVFGGVAAGSAFLGTRSAVKNLYPKKVSYNVFGESVPLAKQKGDRVVVIASNHDASPGSYFVNFALVRKVVFIVAPLSAALFVLFCVVKICVGSDTVPKITSLTIIPFLNSVAGIFVLIMHFSPLQRHARENNGISTAVSIVVYRKLLASPELLPEGTRVCFVSFGGENSAHAGSRAFAKAHPEISGGVALVIGDIEGSRVAMLKRDALRGVEYSSYAGAALFDAVENTGVDCAMPPCDGVKSKLSALHGYAANALREAGCDCAYFTAKSYGGNTGDFRRDDAGKLCSLVLATVVGMARKKWEDKDGEIG